MPIIKPNSSYAVSSHQISFGSLSEHFISLSMNYIFYENSHGSETKKYYIIKKREINGTVNVR